MGYVSRNEWAKCLKHLLISARNGRLVAVDLPATPCEHVVGNRNLCAGLVRKLLTTAAQREFSQLDEKCSLEFYGATASKARKNRFVKLRRPSLSHSHCCALTHPINRMNLPLKCSTAYSNSPLRS